MLMFKNPVFECVFFGVLYLVNSVAFLDFQVTDWLRTDGDDYLETHVAFGDTAAQSEALADDHGKFERNFKV